MNRNENDIYFQKIEEIRDKVYGIYKASNRKDLIMVYNMREDRIYSYIYKEFFNGLQERSKGMVAIQYKEAREANEIVLFIQDDVRRKFKSFTI